jgi:hypothetical protein
MHHVLDFPSLLFNGDTAAYGSCGVKAFCGSGLVCVSVDGRDGGGRWSIDGLWWWSLVEGGRRQEEEARRSPDVRRSGERGSEEEAAARLQSTM